MAEESQLLVSLLTPASDIVQGGAANNEALFARAGNDTIYTDDPAASNTQEQNIDFFFGDLFDNSAEEFEIQLNIQATPQGGNPLLILERDIPSVGADRFVLGDAKQPYYSSSSPDTLLTTNFLGLNEYAVIYDFNPKEDTEFSKQDTIQLNGSPEDYLLVEVNNLKVEGVEQLFSGEAIFSLQQGAPDLIAYAISKDEVDLNLKDEYFDFVVAKSKNKSTEKEKIEQLATTGNDLGYDAATDSSGNVYITGATSGPLFGTNQGSTDVWVAKYDNNGNQLWGKQFGSSSSEEAFAIATDDSGNFYLGGSTGGNLFSTKQSQGLDAWAAKYDSNGNLLWGKQVGTNVAGGFSSSGFGLDVEGGNVHLSGLTLKENQNTEIFDFAVQDDSWVIKFDSNGNQQWYTQIGSFAFDENYDLAVDKDGNSYAVGWTNGLVKESNPSQLLLKYDAWVTKVNPAGQIEWIQQLGSTDERQEFAWAVDTDSQGNVYATGWTTGELGTEETKSRAEERDIWIAKFSPDGAEVWTKQFGSPGDDGGFRVDMDIDSQDNIFITGYTDNKITPGGPADPTYNAWVAKFDSEGTNQWVEQFGSKGNLDYPTGIAVDDAGKIFVSGFTDGLFGTNNTGADSSGLDAWLAQLDAEKGELQKFIGDSNGLISIGDPGAISTVDVSTELVTDELLPSGDNIIKTTQGSDTGVSVVNYGQIVSNLAGIFDPNAQNSFPTVLADGVANNNAPFLSSSDLSLLQQ